VTLSLAGRLALAASGVLAAFLGLTGLTLDRAFREAAEAAVHERLQAQVYALLAAVEVDQRGRLSMPGLLPEVRFATPGSGLYARIVDGAGEVVWRSHSLVGMEVAFPSPLAPGGQRFRRVADGDLPVFSFGFGIAWEGPGGEEWPFTVSVAEDMAAFQAQVGGFRNRLWVWLGASALVLLLVQGSILSWSLRPLRRVASDLAAVERGEREELTGRYPRELERLTERINAFIRHERASLLRYRNSLGDLAHSLKTPLAVLRTAVDEGHGAEALARTVEDQVDRMQATVDYQLGRAATAGRAALAALLPVAPVAGKLVRALDKVYAGRGVRCELRVDTQAGFPGEEGDLMEVLGNLLDNAYKWSAGRVRLSAAMGEGGSLSVAVEDDGPGVPEDQMERVLRRGGRADPATEGHGIGLAMVHDIVSAYGGRIAIGRGELGGAAVRVSLPAG
jgi:two-component system sensor histidine kinase PhoQ